MPATLTAPIRPADQLAAAFARQHQSSPAWLQPIRQAAWTRFLELGLPTTRDEDWRFTNLSPLTALSLAPASQGSSANLREVVFATLPGPCLVFVDGHYAPQLSEIGALPPGVRIGNLAAAPHADECALMASLQSRASKQSAAFDSLNAAFFTDGALILVPDDVVLEAPIRLYNITTSPDAGSMINLRHLIQVGARSRATVIESCLGQTDAAYLNNSVTELSTGASARVEHLKFQDEAAAGIHVSSLRLRLAQGSHAAHHSLALGARLARNNILARLEGEGADCLLNGLYLAVGEQLMDHHMVMEHASPRCDSREFFNGILDDQSRGVFHGRIHVHPGAVKTDAKQTNRNLLLSDEATANTKPQLEIYADDVKCTHGATVGQMNPEQLFYLQARGIDLDNARRMLMHAFAGEIIERIACLPAREELDQLVWNRLEQNPHIAA